MRASTAQPPVVAVDAMGGDHAPEAVVAGALAAADRGARLVLVGDESRLESLLDGRRPTGHRSDGSTRPDQGVIEVVAASEVIGMDEDPGLAVRRKKDASVLRAAELVRDGTADAFVGLGNTGATMAAALLRIGRLRGIRRPAAAAVVPAPGVDRTTVILDVGANPEATPEMLAQFARMGVALSRAAVGTGEPTVALLTIGEEAGKGNRLVVESTDPVRQAVDQHSAGRFVGHAEGRDLIAGTFDVVVTDGFTGNVAIKTMEATSAWVAGLVRRRLGDAAGADHLADLWPQVDPDGHNGAILVGLRGVAVIGHGASGPRAVDAAVAMAESLVTAGVAPSVAAEMSGDGP
jgi:glycerol-3-phosphate acyltransferase PlsX